jgi:hypothetical protein
MKFYEIGEGFGKDLASDPAVGSMKYRCISAISAHLLRPDPRPAAPANARLICAVGPFVGRAGHTSLAP